MEQSIIFDSIKPEDEVKTEETKTTTLDPSANIIVTMIEYSLSDIIKNILLSDEQKKKYSIIIDEENIAIINKVISLTPNTFNDIEKSVKEVIKDGKINTNDIPQLIILVQRIYQVVYEIKNTKFDTTKRAEITSKILKFIIHVLVQERKIKIEKNEEEEFFKQTDLLIDSCVGLLSFPKTIKTKGCLKSLFGK